MTLWKMTWWKAINISLYAVLTIGYIMTRSIDAPWLSEAYWIGTMVLLVSSVVESGRFVKEQLIAMALTWIGGGVMFCLVGWVIFCWLAR